MPRPNLRYRDSSLMDFCHSSKLIEAVKYNAKQQYLNVVYPSISRSVVRWSEDGSQVWRDVKWNDSDCNSILCNEMVQALNFDN